MQARKYLNEIMGPPLLSPATVQSSLVIWHKKSGGGPRSQRCWGPLSGRAVRRRDLPLINIES